VALISFPEHALLIVEARLKEQEVEGIRMPEGMPLDELAVRILVAAECSYSRRLNQSGPTVEICEAMTSSPSSEGPSTWSCSRVRLRRPERGD
jgi:hypothetical protein